MRVVFFVDDNFIGNKASAKAMLLALIDWQTRKGFPMIFSTETSLNLGDEPELMDLLYRANFLTVFVGIESPRKKSLLETRKVQNVRGNSIAHKLERLRENGIVAYAGFIVGFDNDDEMVFDELFAFIQDNGVGIAMVSILSPIPSTPLYARLAAEGRLVTDDPLVWFEPKLMSRATLREGYHELNRRLCSPEAFFARVLRGYRGSAAFRARRQAAAARAPTSRVVRIAGSIVTLLRLLRVLAREGLLSDFGKTYLTHYLAQKRALGRDALSLPDFVYLCVRQWHHYKIANDGRSYWGRAGHRGDEIKESSGVASPAE